MFFAVFGALGGFVSALLYGFGGIDSGAFTSWVIGTGFDGMCIGAALAFAQGRYLGKAFDWSAVKRALRVGGGGGMGGGFAGYLIMMSTMETSDAAMDIARFFGWAIGGLAKGAPTN